jgi:hypothetical protein
MNTLPALPAMCCGPTIAPIANRLAASGEVCVCDLLGGA